MTKADFVALWLIISTIFLLFCFLCSTKYFQNYALITYAISFVFILFLFKKETTEVNILKLNNITNSNNLLLQFNIYKILFILFILFGVAYFSIQSSINLLTQQRIPTNFIIISSIIIFMSQAGGFIIQTLLFYLLSKYNEIPIKLNDCFKIVGLAYSGFLISGIIVFIFNSYNNLQVEEIESLLTNDSKDLFLLTPIIVNKMGEFFTAIFLAFLLKKSFLLSSKKALIISLLPNFILLGSVQLFNFILQ